MLKKISLSANMFVFAVIVAIVMGVGSAGAHVEIMIDPFDEAKNQGLQITELDSVWVAILGSDHVDVRDIKKRTVRLGSRDSEGGKVCGKRFGDVNEDGLEDLLLRFRIEETDLRDAEDNTAVLTGGFVGGREVFASYGTTSGTDSISSSCYTVEGESVTGLRCEFTESNIPLNLAELVEQLNEIIINTDTTISNDSTVIIESYGGIGHDGKKVGTVKVGLGGAGGYATTVMALDDLYDIAENETDIYIYVGQDGPANQTGGSSSVVIAKNISGVSNVLDPSGEKVLCIAGGGGGGGKATFISVVGRKRGYDGGAGGIAVGDLLGDVSAAGEDGAVKNKGRGGNQDGNGSGGERTGGTHSGKAGIDGIGGYGGIGHGDNEEEMAIWNGSQAQSINWTDGQGGEGGKSADAGSGGGGFGGGGGGRGGEHKGGGGGGGSWARQKTVASFGAVAELELGSSYDPGYAAAYLTFELVDDQ